MLPPFLQQGVEERNRLSRVGIVRHDLVRLAKAAIRALEHQIVERRRATSAARADVVDVKGRAVAGLSEPAVLAPALVALEHRVS